MSETLALLQTDVVDSTLLAERLGDAAMAAVWQAHDRCARDLLAAWRGREIDKSDGFLLVFADPADAVGYALAYQRALASLGEPLLARAAVHVGPVTSRATPTDDVARGAKPLEIDGLAKPTVARVMALARGGQTLLTAAAVAALGANPHRVQSHGHWRLKGIETPLELFEIGDDHAAFTPPPDSAKAWRVLRRNDLWLPRREVRHSLPAERDAFVGREAALRDLARRLERGARLVSILGIGGTGKTRLAQRFGWAWLGDFSGGVWFCDLAGARSADGIVRGVAQGLALPLGRADPVAQIGAALAGRGECLVILDNFEQVAQHARATLGQWLDRAADARFIVTTRTLLGLPGEETLALAPLPPADAASLFLRRAEAGGFASQPSADDRAAIDRLVRLLDGLPLAIELCAARTRLMPPRRLLERMSQRFKLLTSSGGRPDRQSTLRATFDWSWDLMTPPEKTALAQLSVFEGGFTLTAAEAIVDLKGCDDPPLVLDVLQSLLDKSLLRQVGDHRFDLLSSVQEYAAEHLAAEGRYPGSGPGALIAAQVRHCDHFAALPEHDALAEGGVEIGNLVAACRRAVAHGNADCAVGALLNAWAGLIFQGPFRGGIELAGVVAAMPNLSDGQRAMVEWVAGSALDAVGQLVPARGRLMAGLSLARGSGDPRCIGTLRLALGAQHTTKAQMSEAFPHLAAALEIACNLDDRMLQLKVFNALGSLATDLGDVQQARKEFEHALELARELGERRWEGGILGNLGILLHGEGRLEAARDHYVDALSLSRETGDRRWEGNNRCNLGLLLHELGRTDDARAEFELALEAAEELGHPRLAATVLCNMGIVAESQGSFGEALGFYEGAVKRAGEVLDQRAEGQFRRYLGAIYARLGRIDESLACLGVGEAMLNDVSDRLSLALLLCARAEVEHLAGDGVFAREVFERARSIAREAGGASDSELARTLERVGRALDGRASFPASPLTTD